MGGEIGGLSRGEIGGLAKGDIGGLSKAERDCVLFIGTRFSNLYTAVVDWRKEKVADWRKESRRVQSLFLLAHGRNHQRPQIVVRSRDVMCC
jgi:hypothetical protein